MPSLFRFLTVVAIIAGIVYGAIFALANFVNSETAGNERHSSRRQISQKVGFLKK